jgi:MFS family permease/DNA-binding Lrp family transcriptional regulator
MGTVKGNKAAITIVVMLAALMAMIDISIVNVALTDIRASFATPLDQIGWISTGYMMANIVVIPMTGWFQRRFGYRRYFAASILLFTAASALCGVAWNLPSLVGFRVLQGLGGGAIIPTAQSLLFARYEKKDHGMAAGLFGLGAITGPLLGPTIGGYLINWSSWHLIFLVNVPIGLVAAVLALRFIEEPGFVPERGRVDVVGIALLAIGMASLQYVLEEGNREGWSESPLILGLGAVALVSLVTFVVHEHQMHFAITRAHWRLVGFDNALLGLFGLTKARYDLLRAVITAPHPLKQTELAVRLGVTEPTVSQMLGSLENLGFVERERGEEDRRCKYVILTKRATRTLERIFAVYVRSGIAGKATARMLVDVPNAPEKVEDVVHRMRELKFALSEYSRYRSPTIALEEIDAGEPLTGEDREIFDAAVDYCRVRFAHLPIDYMTST